MLNEEKPILAISYQQDAILVHANIATLSRDAIPKVSLCKMTSDMSFEKF